MRIGNEVITFNVNTEELEAAAKRDKAVLAELEEALEALSRAQITTTVEAPGVTAAAVDVAASAVRRSQTRGIA